MKQKVRFITQAAIIAALYVILTQIAAYLGLASSAVQIRFSEALTILPFFTSAAIAGLSVGCLLANLLTGCAFWDILFGGAATLLGALGTYFLGRAAKTGAGSVLKWLTPLPPIAANTVIVPFVLSYVYQLPGSIPFLMLTVGLGETISCGVLGLLLLNVLERYRRHLFPQAPG